jgi:hypothetical protein
MINDVAEDNSGRGGSDSTVIVVVVLLKIKKIAF